MIGLDTNILVRAITQDDPKQGPIAARLLLGCTPERPGYVSSISLCELAWVLRHSAAFSKEQVHATLRKLLDAEGLRHEHEAHAERALEGALRGGASFADRLIAELHAAAGVSETLTFDKSAAELDGWRRLR